LPAQAVQFTGDGSITNNFRDAVFPARSTAINIDDPEHRLESSSIPYDQITGSPFWNDSLKIARLYSSKSYQGIYPVRLNFATNEIYFQRDLEELVLTEDLITRIVFPGKDDSAVFISHVPNMLLNGKPIDAFIQVLNSGNYQLLKFLRRKVVAVETPSRTSKSYHFANEVSYFIKVDKRIEFIRKLSKENILLFLPRASSLDSWSKENNISFKNENDIVRVLTYYNSSFKK
jgi:hypothetical protein